MMDSFLNKAEGVWLASLVKRPYHMRFRKNFVKYFRHALCASVFARNINWITLKENIYHNYPSIKTEITYIVS